MKRSAALRIVPVPDEPVKLNRPFHHWPPAQALALHAAAVRQGRDRDE
ncbi:hypothetical protein [Streptomyces sp. NPDC015242]